MEIVLENIPNFLVSLLTYIPDYTNANACYLFGITDIRKQPSWISRELAWKAIWISISFKMLCGADKHKKGLISNVRTEQYLLQRLWMWLKGGASGDIKQQVGYFKAWRQCQNHVTFQSTASLIYASTVSASNFVLTRASKSSGSSKFTSKCLFPCSNAS